MPDIQNHPNFLSKEEILEVLEAAKLYFENNDELLIPAVRVWSSGFDDEPAYKGDEIVLHKGENFKIIISKKVMN